jgi:hypothetical protein
MVAADVDTNPLKLLIDELLSVLPIAAIATAVNVPICLILPVFVAVPLCVLVTFVGIIMSGKTTCDLLRSHGGPNVDSHDEVTAAHKRTCLCLYFNLLCADIILLAFGIIGYGALLRKIGIKLDTSKAEDNLMMSLEALIQRFSFGMTGDQIVLCPASIFYFNFTWFCWPRVFLQLMCTVLITVFVGTRN